MHRLAILILLGSLYLGAVTGCGPMNEYRGPEDSVPAAGGAARGRGGRGAGAPPGLQAQASASQVPLLSEIPIASYLFKSDSEAAQRESVPMQQDQARLMVYTASMGLEVARVEDAIARCLATVNEMGGYLSRRANSTLTCRMPAARFDEFLEDLRAYGRVLSESMQARDVTMQHVDLGIRLDNARRSRERLLALLERAEAVEDLLKIEQELRRLTTEIERMEGELKLLDDQVAMSTVSVTFQPVAAPRTPDGPQKRSRFTWINMTGAEYVLRWF